MEALGVLRLLQREDRPATGDEQRVLARWGGWGAQGLWQIFDEARDQHSEDRATLRGLLSDKEYDAAQRTTINAHYTDPVIAREMWTAVQNLGFVTGRILEPGCGAGTFIGLAPEGVESVGVELDPTTAAIAQALYPQADIRAESFAQTRFPAGTFDLTIGNVPFADITLHDPRYNAGRHAMHNHFIIKSLTLTRPGGLVAVLTSRYTMDAQNPAARREMSDLADLVAAIRLPSGAHKRAAATEAVTDLLILRRREMGTEPAGPGWVATSPVSLPGPSGDPESVRINNYWQEHPEAVLGDPVLKIGMYGVAALEIHGQVDQLGEQLRSHLDDVTQHALGRGAGLTPRTEAQEMQAAAYAPAHDLAEGEIVAQPGNEFAVVDDGQLTPLEVPKPHRAELRSLINLRNQARALVQAEAATLDDTAEIDQARDALASSWRSYAARYGPLNRFILRRTSRVDDETGEPVMARYKPTAIKRFSSDPWMPLVMALENFDDLSQEATPAALLEHRLVVPRQQVHGVDNALDGLAVVLDTHGHVDVDAIADLLGADRAQTIEQLGDAIFEVPDATGADQWVTRADYLSGNVRNKLDQARQAALKEPGRWNGHVSALESVIPADIEMVDIEPRIGSIWIPDTDHEQFLKELLGFRSRDTTVRRVSGSTWEVRNLDAYSVAATQEWGTSRVPAGKLLERLACQQPIIVTDPDPVEKGRRIYNPAETEAAVEKGRQLQERFSEWVWEDPDRATRLHAAYNRRFNSIVLRDYHTEGQALSLPGLAKDFTPGDHQRAAVARMINEQSVGLFHEVGAGKTAEMVIGTTELRRLGLITKPAVCVPNHMLEQFSREWLQLYPQARILAAGTDELKDENRRRFVAKAATGDWDAIILTRTAFERLSLTPANEAAFMDRQLDAFRQALEDAKQRDGESPAFRRVEKKLAAREEKIKEKRAGRRDPGLSFEDTGIDYLVIDEMHEYKNLTTVTSIPAAGIDGSQRAFDLLAKVEYLREHTSSDRVLCGATATPIANHLTEMHVMHRFFNPQGLTDAGMIDFDSWAATFVEVAQNVEVNVTGKFKVKSRLNFTNTPELVRMFRVFADVKTAEDLNLPRPQIQMRPDGQRRPRILTTPASPQLTEFIKSLEARVDQIAAGAVDPTDDNMLTISTDGRKAALDLRLINPAFGDVGGKINDAADELHRVWLNTKDRIYLDPHTNEPSPVPGALQIVFCDYGTPSEQWNAYQGLKDALVARGVPAERIRFIHEAEKDSQKAALFEQCRNGGVSIIVGSTQKMGVGTNIQNRAIHLLELDPPWKPADVTQRQGRALRRGNQNPEIMLTQVVTEGSFDTIMYQHLERKSKLINAVVTGRDVPRQVKDLGDNTLTFAEVKAVTSGHPKLLDLAAAEADVQRLMRLERAHGSSQRALEARISQAEDRIGYIDQVMPQLRESASRTTPSKGDQFRIELCNGATYTDRAAAGAQLQSLIEDNNFTNPIAHLRGHDIHYQHEPAGWRRGGDHWSIPAAPGITKNFRYDQDRPRSPLGTIARLENLPDGIQPRMDALTIDRAEAAQTLHDAQAVVGQPFKKSDELSVARATYERLKTEIAEEADQPSATPSKESALTAVGVAINAHGEAHMPAGLAAKLLARQDHPDPSTPARSAPPPPPDLEHYVPPDAPRLG